jgi:hypothetical protein
MHGHMGAMMPDLKPPRFVVTDDGRDRIKLHYYSSRTGLAPMVVGLIEGLSEKFGEPISIRQIPRHSGSDHDEFEIEMQPQ